MFVGNSLYQVVAADAVPFRNGGRKFCVSRVLTHVSAVALNPALRQSFSAPHYRNSKRRGATTCYNAILSSVFWVIMVGCYVKAFLLPITEI